MRLVYVVLVVAFASQLQLGASEADRHKQADKKSADEARQSSIVRSDDHLAVAGVDADGVQQASLDALATLQKDSHVTQTKARHTVRVEMNSASTGPEMRFLDELPASASEVGPEKVETVHVANVLGSFIEEEKIHSNPDQIQSIGTIEMDDTVTPNSKQLKRLNLMQKTTKDGLPTPMEVKNGSVGKVTKLSEEKSEISKGKVTHFVVEFGEVIISGSTNQGIEQYFSKVAEAKSACESKYDMAIEWAELRIAEAELAVNTAGEPMRPTSYIDNMNNIVTELKKGLAECGH